MKSGKVLLGLVGLFVFTIIFSSGCAEQKKAEGVKPAKMEKKLAPGAEEKLLLKYKGGDIAAYKVVAEVEKSLDFSGEISKDPQFQSGKTSELAELVFTELVEDVDRQGNATKKITIKQLKYVSKERNTVRIDFDSTRENDKGDQLYKLIGQSYTIVISPKAEILNVTGGEEIKKLVAGSLPSNRIAINLVSQEMIRKRHNIPVLADANNTSMKIGDKWNGRKKVSFAQMGSDEYEKIYILKNVEQKGGRRIAVVDITAIPASKEQTPNAIINMFDNVKEFTGELRLDLTAGRVEKYFEKVNSRWVVVNPQEAEEKGKELSAIKMGYMQLQSLEKID